VPLSHTASQWPVFGCLKQALHGQQCMVAVPGANKLVLYTHVVAGTRCSSRNKQSQVLPSCQSMSDRC
jgi:hypothetical protein